jgi:hypothetical protein
MRQPTPHYVVSIETAKHKKAAFIGSAPNDDGAATSAFFITEKPEEAHAFQSFELAKDFRDRLTKGEEDCVLINDGHTWRVSPQP